MKLSLPVRLFTIFCLWIPLVFPARAANDGDLCNGINMLICLPIGLTAALVDQLKPASVHKKMYQAVQEGNLEQVKLLMKRKDSFNADFMLETAANAYLWSTNPSKDANHLSVVRYMMEEGGIDLSGTAGWLVLRSAVKTRAGGTPEDSWKKRVQLASLAIAHGAKAESVTLGDCVACENDQELLPLLISHGANPNDASVMERSLLENFIQSDQFDAAERLMRLGADPNGKHPNKYRSYGHSLLFGLVSSCRKQQADWQQCIDHSIARINFAVAHGADPNGLATKDTNPKCQTPYDLALEQQNGPLAEALLTLGAAADYSARCRQQ